MKVTAEGLSWAANRQQVLRAVTLEALPGETVGIVGPNGSGKSTLLRCLAGLRTPSSGVVRYSGTDIAQLTAKQVARQVAFVEQDAEVASELRVADVVALGRTPYHSPWRGLDALDRDIVAEELGRMGLIALSDRAWRSLSGGERQRAHIARGLAQRTGCLLLDEPANHLDIRHQLELLTMLARSAATVLVSLHDLTLAARFCDRLVMLHMGELVACGTPEEVLTPGMLRAVFGVDAQLETDRLGHPVVSLHAVASAENQPVATADRGEPA